MLCVFYIKVRSLHLTHQNLTQMPGFLWRTKHVEWSNLCSVYLSKFDNVIITIIYYDYLLSYVSKWHFKQNFPNLILIVAGVTINVDLNSKFVSQTSSTVLSHLIETCYTWSHRSVDLQDIFNILIQTNCLIFFVRMGIGVIHHKQW